MGEVSGGGVSPVLVCEPMVEEVVTIAVCESADERTAGVSRRHPPSAAVAIITGRSLIEAFMRCVSAKPAR